MDSAPISETPESNLHFLDYWRVVRLRKSLILTIFFLVLLTVTAVTFILPRQYSSTAVIEVEKDISPISVANPGSMMPTQIDPFFMTTQFKIIESSSILNTVISNLNLTVVLPKDDGSDEVWTLSKTYERLLKHLDVRQTHNTSLIEIEVVCKDKQLAANIANSIVASYKQNRLEKWHSTHNSGIQSATNQLAEKLVELQLAETNLNALFTKLKIPDPNIGESSMTEMTTMDTLRIHLRALGEQEDLLLKADKLLGVVTNLTFEELKESLPTLLDRADAQLGILNQAYTESLLKWIEVTNSFGPKSSEYQAAQKTLEGANHEYTNRIAGAVLALKRSHDFVAASVESLKVKVAQTRDEFSRDAATYMPYYTTRRTVDRLRDEYKDLSSRANLVQMDAQQAPSSVVNVNSIAVPGEKPVKPHITTLILMGAAAGLIFGVGLAFFIEYLDTSVKTIDDIEHALQAPVLGVIPQNVGNILEEGPDTPHAEAYRVLQTNIMFARKDAGKKTISVLSAGAGEGKSTTLFNLAASFAQSGQRVLLVDSDLRRPSIHRILKVSNAVGLTDLLQKQHSIDEVVQKTNTPTLDFIASGKLPSSAMSILGSPQMKALIQELKSHYDFVFFDSPPLLGVHDASILASEMDMVVQVVQYRRYPQPMTLRAKQMIAKVGGNLLGIVLNNINMSQDENYYYYSGYYEYNGEAEKKAAAAGAPAEGVKSKY